MREGSELSKDVGDCVCVQLLCFFFQAEDGIRDVRT